ncbi:NAD-dependent epimerase/dehydratase family protein [Pseudomonas batumici]|uniref:Nucleoside-diphosphate-sugar epimerase n=1 Tax=Pseudomonas batumici TaxID=226910 RepID=A0A0C2EVL8_9PSED|nr:NAD-dependent epimerase/dehydratase family protein [Pseudomonas batumici]KIH82728.1 Nucleoside-diphosphate-sugar epimerase [Pseudomonas batumici]
MAALGNKVLVLGASGGIGGEVARQLRDGGWQVQALKRGLATAAEQRDGIQWLRGDALERDDVVRAAQGCSVIVHGVNPPGYRHWAEQVLPMIDNTIAAARLEGATIVLPGTVYNYGPDAFAGLDEQSAQRPLTRKGRIRVALEQRLRDATRDGVRAIVLRSGDFFGPQAGNSWFSQGMIKPGQAVKVINLPSDPGVGHQWAYLPDVARTMVELLERREHLAPFATFHMTGYWDADGTQIATAIRRVVERAGGRARLRRFPWWLVGLVSPFVTTFREMLEMRYLWRKPLRMSNAHLLSVLGTEPHTPLDQAVETTLKGMRCL